MVWLSGNPARRTAPRFYLGPAVSLRSKRRKRLQPSCPKELMACAPEA